MKITRVTRFASLMLFSSLALPIISAAMSANPRGNSDLPAHYLPLSQQRLALNANGAAPPSDQPSKPPRGSRPNAPPGKPGPHPEPPAAPPRPPAHSTPPRPAPGTPPRPPVRPGRPHAGPPSHPGQPPYVGHGPSAGHPRPGYYFGPRDRDRVRRYYARDFGYINRARRPHFVIGAYIPFGYRSYLRPIPPPIFAYLPPPPPGYALGYFDGYVVVYDPTTFAILSVIDLLD